MSAAVVNQESGLITIHAASYPQCFPFVTWRQDRRTEIFTKVRCKFVKNKIAD